jgi:RNA polymerase sigma factor (sigma-70 family)
MANAFPNTPVSLLACIEERRGGLPYQNAWATFFDLYHEPLSMVVQAAFRQYNWYQVPDDVLEETIADVVVSFFKAKFTYDPEAGRFRNYLRQLAGWRVQDKIAKMAKVRAERLQPTESEDLEIIDSSVNAPDLEIDAREQNTYRAALLATMLEDVRNRVSPQTFLMFEMTKILGHSPDAVAEQFKVKRNVVDNAAYRVLGKLKELANNPEYQREYL